MMKIRVKAVIFDVWQVPKDTDSVKNIPQTPKWVLDCYIMCVRGKLQLRQGDYLILDTNGFLYVCPPEVFERIYEGIDG